MKLFSVKKIMLLAIFAAGLLAVENVSATGTFGPPITATVNVVTDPVTGPFITSSFNFRGDAFDTYVAQDENVVDQYYGISWNYNNSTWNSPELITELINVNFDPLFGSFVNGISRSGDFKVAAWTDATTLVTQVSLNCGFGFIQLPKVPIANPPVLPISNGFNFQKVAVNDFGQVAVLSVQKEMDGTTPVTVYASIWSGDCGAGSWATQLPLGGFPATSKVSLAEVCTDSSGNFFFVWAEYDSVKTITNLFFSTYTRSTGVQSRPVAIGTIVSHLSTGAQVSLVSSANASTSTSSTSFPPIVLAARVDVFKGGSSEIYSLTYQNNVWSPIATVTTGPDFPDTATHPSGGNTFAVSDSGIAQFAYSLLEDSFYTLYSVMTQGSTIIDFTPIWTTTSVIDQPSAGLDVFINACAIWRETFGTNQLIQVAKRSGFSGAWQVPQALALDFALDLLSLGYVNVTEHVSAVARYNQKVSILNSSNGLGLPLTTINFNLSVGLDIFLPQGALNFIGERAQNRFATQIDRMIKLTWKASVDPTVVAYNLYRDGVLIRSFPTTVPFVFFDHNRKKGKTYTYQIRTVNGAGLLSLPSTVVING